MREMNRVIRLCFCLLLGICGPVDAMSLEGRMQNLFREYLAAHLAKDPANIEVTNLSPLLPSVALEDRLEVLQGSGEASQGGVGQALFLMKVTRHPGGESRHWVRATVSVIQPVWVAARLIQRKERIAADALSVQRRSLTSLARPYVAREEELWGKRAIRSILPGTPITLDMLEEAPTLRKGDRVTLRVEADGMIITTMGRAKQDGFLGQPLAVTTEDNKTVHGILINPSWVRVNF